MDKPATREQILSRYHIDPASMVGRGMEAEVYANGPDAVLKLYDGTASLEHLLTLRDFYHTLPRTLLPYAVPHIVAVAHEEPFVVTVEQRLHGVPLQTLLPGCSLARLDMFMGRYLAAALALSQVAMPPDIDRYRLFDAEQLSARADGDWHQFLDRTLAHKLAHVGPYLCRDVALFDQRVAQLRALLAQPYAGPYRLIHGDFFPGNLLVDDEGQISALLDFGMLTMYGDPLFDLATGWVFFDMYDELGMHARERYFELLLEQLGSHVRGALHRYVLIYSIISANTYSATCADGHYQWCAANLNTAALWHDIG